MTDIAHLGLAVDSTQVKSATSDLDRLTPAAARAERAASGLEAAARRTGTQFKGMSFEARNLGFQLVDVTQGALMGQSAFQIFAQQGGQVAQVIATSPRGLGGLVKELAGGLRALISPATLAAGTVALLGVGAYTAYSSWKTFALQLDDTAKIAGTTSSAMAQLQAAASFKGIEQGDFAKGVQGFAAQLYQARNNTGDLIQMLRVNGVSAAGDFSTVLGRVADLVRDAAGNTELQFRILRSAGLPATMEWVRFLSQGADGIKRATDEAVKFGGAANDNLVEKARKADEEWNKFWTNFSYGAKTATVNAAGWITNLMERMRQAQRDIQDRAAAAGVGGMSPNNRVAEGFSAALGRPLQPVPGPKPRDSATVLADIARQQQALSLLGQTITATEARRAVELQLQAAQVAGIGIDSKRAEILKQLAYEQALGVTAIKAATDATNLETAAIGVSIGQATAQAAAQNAINDARRRGVELLPQEIALIQQNAAALGQAAQRADEMRFAYDTFSGTMRDLTQQVRQNGLSWQTLGNVASNALGKIADRLMDMASRALWQNALGPLFGGFMGGGGLSLSGGLGIGGSGVSQAAMGGGFGGGIFTARSGGLVGSLTSRAFVHPAYFDDAPRFSTGGRITDDGVPIIAHPGERILNRQQTRAYDEGRGSAAPVVNITQNNTFDGVNSMTKDEIARALAETKRQAVNEAVQAVATVSGNTPAYRGQVSGR